MNTKTNLLDWNWHTNTYIINMLKMLGTLGAARSVSLISKTFIIPTDSFAGTRTAQKISIRHECSTIHNRTYASKSICRRKESQIVCWHSMGIEHGRTNKAKMFICFCWPKIQFNVWNVNICTHPYTEWERKSTHTDVHYGIVEKSERHRLWSCFCG